MGITLALAGNPNSGKTTLFNELTGSNQFVGNWPGVTVEKKEGKIRRDKNITVVDLPGIYSLSPYTPEEIVARNYLVNERPNAIINIIDGTNIERNLYLTTQLVELGIPVVLAINMIDIVEKNGDKVDLAALEKHMGCPVVKISALNGKNVDEVVKKAVEIAEQSGENIIMQRFHDVVESGISEVSERLSFIQEDQRRYYAIKLLERDEKILSEHHKYPDVSDVISSIENELQSDIESIIIDGRYNYITSIIGKCFIRKSRSNVTLSDKIDNILTHRVFALPIFALVMFVVYFISVSTVGGIFTDWANDGVFGEGWELFGLWIPGVPVLAEELLGILGTADWLNSLIIDGIIGGVGAVLGFVPQILVLFLLLAFLEGCGYMSRIAFVLDRIFRKFGLSGKSFIPMLIGTGCGVPGIMASRTIESERDRKMTIMVTTFIPCSAKLPIIALIAGAMFGGAWWVAPCAYFIGILAIIISGLILQKFRVFSGENSPFVMELPPYHMPKISYMLRSMWDKGWSFIKKAGTIILVSSVVLWFAAAFGYVSGELVMVDDLADSFLANIGNLFAWIFAPLGFGTWQATVATLTGLIAKENVVGTFGVLFGLGEVAESDVSLHTAMISHFTEITAFAFMVFNLLCAPCFAAIGAIYREMNSIKWTLATVGYQTIFAYLVALCVNQFGMLFTGGGFHIGTFSAALVVVMFIYLIFKPKPKQNIKAKVRKA